MKTNLMMKEQEIKKNKEVVMKSKIQTYDISDSLLFEDILEKKKVLVHQFRMEQREGQDSNRG